VTQTLPRYQSKTPERLKQIATDLQSGRIYTSQQIPPGMKAEMVFMVLIFAGENLIDWIQKNDIAVLFESMDRAGPTYINGQPVFFSCEYLSDDEWRVVQKLVGEIDAAIDGV